MTACIFGMDFFYSNMEFILILYSFCPNQGKNANTPAAPYENTSIIHKLSAFHISGHFPIIKTHRLLYEEDYDEKV